MVAPRTSRPYAARGMRLAIALGGLATASCNRSPAASSAPAPIVEGVATPHAPHAPVMREGGFDAALQDARRAHQLVVLDFWASWCPPCMSMRASTFPDPALYALADKLTWVSVDRDTDEGDALAKRLGIRALPALFVFDPDTGVPRARWNSPLPGPDLAALLDAVSATPPVDGVSEIFTSAFVTASDRDIPDGDRARVRSLLAHSSPTWPLTPFAAQLLVLDARHRGAFDECLDLESRYADRLPVGGLRTAIVMGARDCANKTTPPRADVARALLDAGEKLVDDPATPLLPFERAWDYAALWDTRGKLLGDAAGAARLRQRWLGFLRNEQAHGSPAVRATLAAPLEFALGLLGDKAGALDALAEAAQAEPASAEALLRYVSALDEANRVDDAIAAVTRGVEAIPEPRRIPVLWAEAKLLRKKSDAPKESAVLDAAIALFPRTPSSPHFDAVREAIKERRAALSSAGK